MALNIVHSSICLLTFFRYSKQADTRLMTRLRTSIKALLLQQEADDTRVMSRPSAITMGGSSGSEPSSPVSERRPRNRRSYERHRPSSSLQSPVSPLSPSSGTFSDIPPSAPDFPGSSQGSSASQSSTSDALADHWAKRVFMDEHTITPVPYVGGRSDVPYSVKEAVLMWYSSKCFGDSNSGAKRWLREEGFEELFQLLVLPSHLSTISC